MKKEEKYIKLSAEQMKNIETYLQSRLGKYNILSHKFQWEDTPSYTFKQCAIQK